MTRCTLPSGSVFLLINGTWVADFLAAPKDKQLVKHFNAITRDAVLDYSTSSGHPNQFIVNYLKDVYQDDEMAFDVFDEIPDGNVVY